MIGDRAYKLKRAVRYSFLDFSTLAKRQAALMAEYRLNVRTAPELYRRLVAVTSEGAHRLALDGSGAPVEWLLEMVRFDQEALFDHLAEEGLLDGRLMSSLAAVIAELHRTADVRSSGGYGAMSAIVDGNARDLAVLAGIIGDAGGMARLNDMTGAALSRHRDLLERRCQTGFVRHCHGDLHLGNIVLLDDRPVLFDCLEFDENLASIDLLYDLAFLLMDLCHRGFPDLAIGLFNDYLGETWDDRGCALLPLFLAIRATIRAKIEGFEIETAASAQDRAEHGVAAEQYLALASDLLAVEPPRLIAIGGFSGSGKSTVARGLTTELGMKHWAVLLRSDLIRKRLHGMAPTERLAPDAYRPSDSSRVYQALLARAGDLLAAGRTVIADATFLNPADRNSIETLAKDLAVPFHGLWLDAPSHILARRITARRDDASDASVDVLASQLERDIGALTWSMVDATGHANQIAGRIHRSLHN